MPESFDLRSSRTDGTPHTISLLVPELPSQEQLRPWLERIDANRWYTNFGPLVKVFEERAGRFLRDASGRPLAVAAVCSATLGLELAISQLSLPPGSRILVPSFTFPASACAIARSGHVPVFADIDPESLTLSPTIAERACAQQKIHAIMPVATLGISVAQSAWDAFAQDAGLPLIVDAAGAIGNQSVGDRGVYVFSLHATKPLAMGEGGLVVSSDRSSITRIKQLSNFGFDGTGITSAIGTNAKMSEYHAAVGLAALDSWGAKARKLQNLLGAYRNLLAGVSDSLRLLIPAGDLVLSSLVVQIDSRLRSDIEGIRLSLADQGIQTRRWYYPPLHQQPAFSDMPTAGSLEVTEEVAVTSLGLPFHTFLTRTEVERVVISLKRLVGL